MVKIVDCRSRSLGDEIQFDIAYYFDVILSKMKLYFYITTHFGMTKV